VTEQQWADLYRGHKLLESDPTARVALNQLLDEYLSAIQAARALPVNVEFRTSEDYADYWESFTEAMDYARMTMRTAGEKHPVDDATGRRFLIAKKPPEGNE
jgi:hypothetical protein